MPSKGLCLVALLFTQDSNWIDRCASLDPAKAETLRVELAEGDGKSGLLRAVRAVLLEASRRGDRGGPMLKALSAHLQKFSTDRDHRKGLSAESTLLALGHLDELLNTGGDPKGLASELSRLRVTASGGQVATRQGAALAELRAAAQPEELGKTAAGAFGPEISYTAAILLLKQGDVQSALGLLLSLRREFPDHANCLLSALKDFKPCAACKGTRKVPCQACGGKRWRAIVCPQCDGAGHIAWNPNVAKDPGREAADKPRGFGADRTYCPTCVSSPQYKARRTRCDGCDKTGSVVCQKCRWQKFELDSICTLEPCKNCDKSGSMFVKILHPCAFCKGLGEFVIPREAPEKRVGPAR